MVSQASPEESAKKEAAARLRSAQALVRRHRWRAQGDIVLAKAKRCGYDDEDISTLICKLSPDHYRSSHRYDLPFVVDDFVIKNYMGPRGELDDMYVKFGIDEMGNLVLLCSCHWENMESFK